jgi:TRAP-type C4-dicarboxylate transport system substrate-binding protein
MIAVGRIREQGQADPKDAAMLKAAVDQRESASLKLKVSAPSLFSNIKSFDRNQTNVLTPEDARGLRLRVPTN